MMVALAGAAFPSTIVNVQFVGPGTSVSDPSGVAVTPYVIQIGGVQQLVTCYDYVDHIDYNQTWQAYEYSLDDAVNHGLFSSGFGDAETGYKSIGWLSTQTYSDADHEVGLQYAIWSVFENGSLNFAQLTSGEWDAYQDYETALNAQINYVDPITTLATPFNGFDFSHTVFLEPTSGAVGGQNPDTPQPFVFAIDPDGGNQSSTPEPGTLVMIGSGLLCLLSSLGFKRFAGKNS